MGVTFFFEALFHFFFHVTHFVLGWHQNIHAHRFSWKEEGEFELLLKKIPKAYSGQFCFQYVFIASTDHRLTFMKSVVELLVIGMAVFHSARDYSECRHQHDRQRIHDGSVCGLKMS